MIKRIRISELQRAGLLIPGNVGLLRFEDGTKAIASCTSEHEVLVGYQGISCHLIVVRTQRRRAGVRPYFLIAGKRVLDVYWHGELGWTSRHEARLRFSCEPTAAFEPIPRRGSAAYARMSPELLR